MEKDLNINKKDTDSEVKEPVLLSPRLHLLTLVLHLECQCFDLFPLSLIWYEI